MSKEYKKDCSPQYRVFKKLFIKDMVDALFIIEDNVMLIANDKYKVNGIIQNRLTISQINSIQKDLIRDKVSTYTQDVYNIIDDGIDNCNMKIIVRLQLKDDTIMFENSSLIPLLINKSNSI